jgi:hypothetical protein
MRTALEDQILSIVGLLATECGLTTDDLLSPCRSASLVKPRQLAMWLAFRWTKASKALIGEVMHRDHTTVAHGIRMADTRLRADKRAPLFGMTAADVLTMPATVILQCLAVRKFEALGQGAAAITETFKAADREREAARHCRSAGIFRTGGRSAVAPRAPIEVAFFDDERDGNLNRRRYFVEQNDRFAAAMRAALAEEALS